MQGRPAGGERNEHASHHGGNTSAQNQSKRQHSDRAGQSFTREVIGYDGIGARTADGSSSAYQHTAQAELPERLGQSSRGRHYSANPKRDTQNNVAP